MVVSSTRLKKLELVYIDHSQRDDTNKDIQAIQLLADEFNLQFHTSKLDLPPNCSEQVARELRYKELERIRSERELDAIITAHHADDVAETAIINLTRGTGPKGLTSLRHHSGGIWRPFLFKLSNRLFITKADLQKYAEQNNLKWHEDSTNNSNKYLRNRVRQSLRSSSEADKQKLLRLIANQQQTNLDINLLTTQIIGYLLTDEDTYSRPLFLGLSEDIQKQVLHSIISDIGYDINRQAVLRALEFIQAAATKKTLQLKGCDITITTKDSFSILPARQNKL
jgi:tRNA(Ile)-lysidine synthase